MEGGKGGKALRARAPPAVNFPGMVGLSTVWQTPLEWDTFSLLIQHQAIDFTGKTLYCSITHVLLTQIEWIVPQKGRIWLSNFWWSMPSANRFESLFSPFKLSRHKCEAGHTCVDRIKSVISVFDANPSLGCVRLQSKRFISAFDASSPLGCCRAGTLF